MTRQKFSTREKEVIEYLLKGKSNKEIAQGMGVSVRTVEFHLSNIYSQLDVHSRTEAVINLQEAGGPASRNTGSVYENPHCKERSTNGK
jgi:DNA-binding NarL/FixJ family response regulator